MLLGPRRIAVSHRVILCIAQFPRRQSWSGPGGAGNRSLFPVPFGQNNNPRQSNLAALPELDVRPLPSCVNGGHFRIEWLILNRDPYVRAI
jgi:hypothetical protein